MAPSRRKLMTTAGAAAVVAAPPGLSFGRDVEGRGGATTQMLEACLQTTTAAGLPGVSAAIASREEVIWTGCAGRADVEASAPITLDHRFGVGSITKLFVAVVVLQLVQEGQLSTEARPEQLLGSAITVGIANASTATVGQLLAHTSGIPSWEDLPAWIADGRGRNLDPRRLWGKTDALDYIRSVPALCAPGATFNYSNSGYTLLGLIIEHVTGRSAAEEIRRRVLEPLSLKNTYLEGVEAGDPARTPRRYHYATSTFVESAGVAPAFPEVRPGLIDVTASNLSVEWTAGAIVSSPTDLATFAVALRDGRLLEPAGMAYMRMWRSARSYADMGHGLFRFLGKPGCLQGHNGSVLGFTGSLWWSEIGDVAVAVLANVGAMHSGTTPPTAYDVALLSDFRGLAPQFAAAHRRGDG